MICLGSGSSGNLFAIQYKGETVLCEVGFEQRTLLNRLISNGISLTSIKSVICTHQHKDHCVGLPLFIKLGVGVYAPTSCYGGLERNKWCFDIKANQKYKLAEWLYVYCFQVNHDCDAYGFVFWNKETKESILFINDTEVFDFPLKNMTFDEVYIECNYCDIDEDNKKHKRQAHTHLSLDGTIYMLKQINLTKTKMIHLTHISQELGNEDKMRETIMNEFNIPTVISKLDNGK